MVRTRRIRLGKYLHQLTVMGMLLPYLVGLTALVLVPSALALGLAFTRFDALTPPTWVGLANFVRLGNDRLFWLALSNTLLYLLLPCLYGLAVPF